MTRSNLVFNFIYLYRNNAFRYISNINKISLIPLSFTNILMMTKAINEMARKIAP